MDRAKQTVVEYLPLVAVGSVFLYTLLSGPKWEGPFVQGGFPLYVKNHGGSKGREYKILVPGTTKVAYHYRRTPSGITVYSSTENAELLKSVKKALGLS